MSLLKVADTSLPIDSLRDDQYVLDVLAWRRGLSEMNVRSLAYEYITGNIAEECRDAYLEYLHRFGKDNRRGPRKEFPKRSRGTKRSSMGRRSRGD